MAQDPTIITSNNPTRFSFAQLQSLTNSDPGSPLTQFAIGIPNSSSPLTSLPGMVGSHPAFINTLTNANLTPTQVNAAGIHIPITTQLLVTAQTQPLSTNAANITSPIHNNNNNNNNNNTIISPTQAKSSLSLSPNAPDWRQVQVQQKKQKTGSTSEWKAHPTTPTISTPSSKISNEWNQMTPKTPTTPISKSINITTPISSIQNVISNGNSHIPLKLSVSSPPTPTTSSASDVHGVVWSHQYVLENSSFKESNSQEWSDNSEDSPTTPNPLENNPNDWTSNQNGQGNNIMPQTPTSSTENGSDPSTPTGNDAEGVWSPDIEQAFQEALAIYPPCGRRKIILSDEGKMYGRNELIARYIKLRTGKSRSRKQVSSHIQVLAKKKAREIQGKIKDPIIKDKAMANLSSMSSAQIVSASTIHNRPSVNMFAPPGMTANHIHMGHMLSNAVNPITIKQENMPNTSLIWHPQAAFVQQTNHNMTSLANIAIPITAIPSSVGPNIQALNFNQAAILPQGFISHLDTNSSEIERKYENNSNIGASQQSLEIPLRMTNFCAFVESQSTESDTHMKHIFVQINQGNFSNPEMESIDICHICDKFPEKNGGLKDLYEKGPQHVFFLVKFWGSLNATLLNDSSNTFYGVSSRYEGLENKTITCSTKVCSFGKQVVEKVETEYPKSENGRYVYNINRSPMCEYMLNFIQRLIHLPEKYMMNSVLENFSILQVVSDRETQDTLLCLAYIFEVNTEEGGTRHCIYRLEQEQKDS